MHIKLIYTCIIYVLALNLCFAKDYKVEPYIYVEELYSDNVLLVDDDEQGEFATTLNPGLYAIRDGSRLKARFNYALEQIYITGDDVPDNTVHNLRADAIGELYKDHLFLDVSANNGQQNVASTQSIAADNITNFGNREDVFFYRVNPFWKQKISDFAKMTIGHTYDEVLSDIGDSDSNFSYINLVNGNRFQKLLFNFEASHRTVGIENAQDDVSFSNIQNQFIYPITRTFSATGTIGYDSDDIQGVSDTSGHLWNVGFLWRPTKNTNVNFSAGERYFGSDIFADVGYARGRTELRLTYQRERQTARDLLTQTTSEILYARGASGLLDEQGKIIDDRSFVSPSILDATAIDQNGQTLLNTELRAIALYTYRRNVYRLGFFMDENEFQQANNAIESFGVDLGWERQISRSLLSNLNLVYQTRDLQTGIETQDYVVDLLVTKNLSKNFNIDFGYRLSLFESDNGSLGEFTENRIFVGINKVF